MEKKYDIIGIANPGQDLVVELPEMPYNAVSSKMYDCSFQGGGWVATALCAAGSLGAKAAFLGIVGGDAFGRLIIDDFKFNRVDTSRIIVEKDKRSNFCICITERSTKSKHIISRGGELREVELKDIDFDFVRSAKIMHVGFVNEAVCAAADAIHAAGGKVSVDAAYYKPYVYKNYGIFDIFIGSEYYFDGVCAELGKGKSGEMSQQEKIEVMRYIASKGPEIVIFTFGENGSLGICGGESFYQPAMKVEVADTTGAGDVYHGAFLTAYLKGMSIPECMCFATGVSSIKCTKPGGRAGIPDLKTLERFLATGEVDVEKLDERMQRYKFGLQQ